MRTRWSVVAVVLTSVIASVATMAVVLGQSGQSPDAVPRTLWGDPDLQGIWDGKTQTPLERPERYGGREFLTDEEVAALEERSLENRGRDVRAEPGSLLDVADAYNNIWSSSHGLRVVRTGRSSLSSGRHWELDQPTAVRCRD